MNENLRLDPVVQDKFYLCMHSLKAFPDLTYEVLQQSNGKMFLVISKQRDCVTYTCDGVDIVIKPARIVVDESGKGSLQVLYRCLETVSSASGLFDLMKKLSSVGGYCLCTGLGEDVDDPSNLSDVNCQYPFPRAESATCLKWFQPKRRGYNAALARCPECTKWVKTKRCRLSMQLKRSSSNSNEASTSQKAKDGTAIHDKMSLDPASHPDASLSSTEVNLRKPLCLLSADDLRTRCRFLQSTIYKQRRSLKRLKTQLAKTLKSPMLKDITVDGEDEEEEEDTEKTDLDMVVNEIILNDDSAIILQDVGNSNVKSDSVNLGLS